MRIEIFCSGCKKDLEVVDSNISHLGFLQLFIRPCYNKDCQVCGDCEELEAKEEAEKKLEEVEKELKKVKEKLKKIEMIFIK